MKDAELNLLLEKEAKTDKELKEVRALIKLHREAASKELCGDALYIVKKKSNGSIIKIHIVELTPKSIYMHDLDHDCKERMWRDRFNEDYEVFERLKPEITGWTVTPPPFCELSSLPYLSPSPTEWIESEEGQRILESVCEDGWQRDSCMEVLRRHSEAMSKIHKESSNKKE